MADSPHERCGREENGGEHRASFETTQWSVVLAASQEIDSLRARAALEALCRNYWFPLFACARRHGYSAADAQDLVQGFFARILERRDLQSVRKERGRFRSYLLSALKNFMANEWSRAAAQKRGGGAVPIPLDDLVKAHGGADLPVDDRSPDRVFDQQWALALLARVLERLRDEQRGEGRARQFDLLQPFLLEQHGARSQAEIAAELGISEGAVKQAVFRLRQRYRKLMHDEVAHTVGKFDDVEDELRYLVTALRG
jgi:RNA polymerase sigma factor (sigma-70 family)